MIALLLVVLLLRKSSSSTSSLDIVDTSMWSPRPTLSAGDGGSGPSRQPMRHYRAWRLEQRDVPEPTAICMVSRRALLYKGFTVYIT
jgi:hypothetical protein